jgi:hypothetical protein
LILQPAFRHVIAESIDDSESVPPSLTVLCGVVNPHTAISENPAVSAGLIFFDGPVRVAWDRSSDGVSAYDRSGRIGIWTFPSIESVPVWELASPMRRVFHWWSADEGMLLMHGAAVGFSDFGILLAGKGGAGKSTTALASIGLGWQYAGDDYCLIAPESTPQIHSLYCSGKVSAASIDRLPRIRNLFDESTLKIEQKTIAFLYPEWGNEFIRSLPLTAIVTPQIAHRSEPIIQPVSAAKAMLSLAPSTMMQMPGERPYSLTTLAEIARSTPCFELMLSDDPDAAYACLADLRPRLSR